MRCWGLLITSGCQIKSCEPVLSAAVVVDSVSTEFALASGQVGVLLSVDGDYRVSRLTPSKEVVQKDGTKALQRVSEELFDTLSAIQENSSQECLCKNGKRTYAGIRCWPIVTRRGVICNHCRMLGTITGIARLSGRLSLQDTEGQSAPRLGAGARRPNTHRQEMPASPDETSRQDRSTPSSEELWVITEWRSEASLRRSKDIRVRRSRDVGGMEPFPWPSTTTSAPARGPACYYVAGSNRATLVAGIYVRTLWGLVVQRM